MRWRDDLPDDWEDVDDDPPVADQPVDPLLLGVDVDELVVTLHHLR